MVPIALDTKNEEIISLIGSNITVDDRKSWASLLELLFAHAIRVNDAATINNLVKHISKDRLEEGLIYSAEIGTDSALRALLKNGVDVDSKEHNKRARTALMLAAKKGHPNAIKVLLSFGANIHLRSERRIGLTALEYAKIYRRRECIKVLRLAYVYEKYGDSPLVRSVDEGDLNEILVFAKDEPSLITAINIAKALKQPRSLIRKLRIQLKRSIPRTHKFPFANLFKRG